MSPVSISTRDAIDDFVKALASSGSVTINLEATSPPKQLSKTSLSTINEDVFLKELKRLLRYMRQRNLITIHQRNGHAAVVSLAQAGKERLQKLAFTKMKISTPKKWDEKWRIVFFDIPEQHKQARNALTIKLKNLGFYQLQRSVWVHPFSCYKEIDVINRVYRIGPYVTIAEVTAIDKHSSLVNHFRSILPS
jgi:CRISPR-associated endonuclease Cas2